MQNENLDIVRKIIYLISLISVGYQFSLLNNQNDFVCILLVFISNIIITRYCLNPVNFFSYPISNLIIFFSHFVNYGGSLYLKSIELSLITTRLEEPLSTFSTLFIFHFIILMGHYIYRNLNFAKSLSQYISIKIDKFGLGKFENLQFLILLSILGVLARFFYFNFNVSMELQTYEFGATLLQDILAGFSLFIYFPIIIYFSKYLYNLEIPKKFKLYFLIYFLLILFFSISRNSRSLFLDFIFLNFLIFFIIFLLNKIKMSKKSSFYIIIILIISIPTINIFENLSKNFLFERSISQTRTPYENVKSFLNSFSISKSAKEYSFQEDTYLAKQLFFAEDFYETTLFNRINILIIHDNFLFLKKNINKNEVIFLRDLQLGKIISVLPGPIISIFNNEFDKMIFNKSQTASYLYNKYSNGYYGDNMIGSSLMSLYILFDVWIFPILLFFFIPFFILFDSFYNQKNNFLNPYILLFLYTTNYGILNFLTLPEISLWFYVIRKIIETFLIIYLIKIFFYKIIKQKL